MAAHNKQQQEAAGVEDLMFVVQHAAEVQNSFVDAAQYHTNGIVKLMQHQAEHSSNVSETSAKLVQSSYKLSASNTAHAVQAASAANEAAAARNRAAGSALSEVTTGFLKKHATVDLTNDVANSAFANLEAEMSAKATAVKKAEEVISSSLTESAALRQELHSERVKNINLIREGKKAQQHLDFALSQLHGNREEVLSLLKVIDQMGSKVERAETMAAEHARLKRILEALEKNLNLSDAIKALAPEGMEPMEKDNTVAHQLFPAALRGPMPNRKLQEVAPELYSMQLLAHRRVTLSEMVDSWLESKHTIERMQKERDALELELATVHRNGHRVFLQLNNEEKRRKHAESQLEELGRQRVDTDAARTEITSLHKQLSKSRDEHAAATVLLQQLRLDAKKTADELEESNKKVKQLKDDQQVAGFANTVAHMRANYNKQVAKLTSDVAALSTSAAGFQAAAEALRRDNASLTRTVHATKAANERFSIDREATARKTAQMEAKIRELSTENAKLNSDVTKGKNALVAATQQNLFMASTQPLKTNSHFTPQVEQIAKSLQTLNENVTKAIDTVQNISTPYQQAGRCLDRDTVVNLRDSVLAAHRLLSSQTLTSEEFRATLVDRSLSEAHQVETLVNELDETREEKERLEQQLARLERLLEANSIDLTEVVAMRPMDHHRNDPHTIEDLEETLGATNAKVTALEAQVQAINEELERERDAHLETRRNLANRSTEFELLSKRQKVWASALGHRDEDIACLRAALISASAPSLPTDTSKSASSARGSSAAANSEHTDADVEGGEDAQGNFDETSETSSVSEDHVAPTSASATVESLTALLTEVTSKFQALRDEVFAKKSLHGEQAGDNDAEAVVPAAEEGEEPQQHVDNEANNDDNAKPSLKVERLAQINDILREMYAQVDLYRNVERAGSQDGAGSAEEQQEDHEETPEEEVEEEPAGPTAEEVAVERLEHQRQVDELSARVAQLEQQVADAQADKAKVSGAAVEAEASLKKEIADLNAAKIKLQGSLEQTNQKLQRAMDLLKNNNVSSGTDATASSIQTPAVGSMSTPAVPPPAQPKLNPTAEAFKPPTQQAAPPVASSAPAPASEEGASGSQDTAPTQTKNSSWIGGQQQRPPSTFRFGGQQQQQQQQQQQPSVVLGRQQGIASAPPQQPQQQQPPQPKPQPQAPPQGGILDAPPPPPPPPAVAAPPQQPTFGRPPAGNPQHQHQHQHHHHHHQQQHRSGFNFGNRGNQQGGFGSQFSGGFGRN